MIEYPTERQDYNPSLEHGIMNISCIVSGTNIRDGSWWKGSQLIQRSPDFDVKAEIIHGNFSFGQSTARKSTLVFKVDKQRMYSCETVAQFDDVYWYTTNGLVHGNNRTLNAKLTVKMRCKSLGIDTSLFSMYAEDLFSINIVIPSRYSVSLYS